MTGTSSPIRRRKTCERKCLESSYLHLAVACLTTVVSAVAPQSDAPRLAADDPALRPADYQPSGDYYDWRKTGQPERPWFHKYDQSLVMKIFLAERTDEGRGCQVYTARGLVYYLRCGEQLEIPSEQRGEGRRVLVMG